MTSTPAAKSSSAFFGVMPMAARRVLAVDDDERRRVALAQHRAGCRSACAAHACRRDRRRTGSSPEPAYRPGSPAAQPYFANDGTARARGSSAPVGVRRPARRRDGERGVRGERAAQPPVAAADEQATSESPARPVEASPAGEPITAPDGGDADGGGALAHRRRESRRHGNPGSALRRAALGAARRASRPAALAWLIIEIAGKVLLLFVIAGIIALVPTPSSRSCTERASPAASPC